MKFKFAHLADCHLGAWGNHPDMREFPLQAFAKAVDKVISEQLDFVLIAGDFFDSSMPAVDVLRFATEQLMRLKQAGIRVYAVAGSHDYSPTGKTMLSVLEAADLLQNAHMKWIADKTGARIFGVEGLRGGLDKETFGKVKQEENSDGYKILLFHAAIDELSKMKGVPLASIPAGFDYYATGHVHAPLQHAMTNSSPCGSSPSARYNMNSLPADGRYTNSSPADADSLSYIVFPGPMFPAEFSELEELGCGSFCIVNVTDGGTNSLAALQIRYNTTVSTIQLQTVPVLTIDMKCDDKTPQQIESEFIDCISSRNVANKIVLLKASGVLAGGKTTDINWKRITEFVQHAGALAVKRSVHLNAEETKVTDVDVTGSLAQIEQAIISKNIEQISEREIIAKLMDVLAVEKSEDEKTSIYEDKIKFGARKILQVV